MGLVEFIAYVSLAMVLMAILPVTYVLVREALRRRQEQRDQLQEQEALNALEGTSEADVDVTVTALKSRFAAETLERAMVRFVRGHLGADRPARLFGALGLNEHYLWQLRHAEKWGDRAHAAELLGLVGEVAACAPLLEILRDANEDITVKRAASDALGRIRKPEAVETLVDQLRSATHLDAPRLSEVLISFGEQGVPALLDRGLPATQGDTRLWTLRILGQVRAKQAVNVILGCFEDPREPVRAAAAEALGHIGDKRATRRLAELAQRDPAGAVRSEAARALGKLGDEEGYLALRNALNDADHGARLRALEAFEILQPEDKRPLEQLLRDPHPQVRRRAALALERVGYVELCLQDLDSGEERRINHARTALEMLCRAGLDTSLASRSANATGPVRAALLDVLANAQVRSGGEAVLAAVTDENPDVRARAAAALGTLQPERAAEKLVSLLYDPAVHVSEQAARALSRIPVESLRPHMSQLRGHFHSASPVSRKHLVTILADDDDEQAQQIVVAATNDPDDAVRTAALSMIPRFAGSISISALVDKISDPCNAARAAAIHALGSVRVDEARDALMDQLSEADELGREHIAEALSKHGVNAMADRLEAIVVGDNVNGRLGVAWALGKTASEDAVSFLSTLLHDPDKRVRASAAGALGKIPSRLAAKALVGGLSDPDPRTRAAVVNACGRLGFPESIVINALTARLHDPDAFVRNRAAISLALLSPETFEEHEFLIASLIEDEPYTIALGVSGREALTTRAAKRLGDSNKAPAVLAKIEREPEHIRDAFIRNLHLRTHGESDAPLDLEAVIEAQLQILRSSAKPDERREAIAILGGMSAGTIVASLADALVADPSLEVRCLAAEQLGPRLPDLSARQALEAAVYDPSTEVCKAAVQALDQVEDDPPIELLLGRVPSANRELLASIENTLVKHQGLDPMTLTTHVLTSQDPKIISCGLRVMQRASSWEFGTTVRTLTKSTNVDVRIAAIRAIGSMAESTLLALAETALAAPNPAERMAALDALADAGRPTRVGRLVDAVMDPSQDIRVQLAKRLGEFNFDVAGPILEQLASDVRASVCSTALVSMLQGASADALLTATHILESVTSEVRKAVLVDARALDAAERIMHGPALHPSVDVRAAAIKAVAALRTKGLERELMASLLDPAPIVRTEAISALAGSDDEQVQERLRGALDDPSEQVREAARRSRLKVVG